MNNRLLLAAFVFFVQSCRTSAQRQWIPPTTTAAEMRNPYTWYWPYAIARAEAYRNYFQNAQQINNQLYMQAYATNAFWWTNRPGGGGGGGQSGQSGQFNSSGQGQGGQNWNPAQGGQGGQGGQNWNPGQGGQNWNPGQGGQNWTPEQGGQGGQNWNGPGFLEW